MNNFLQGAYCDFVNPPVRFPVTDFIPHPSHWGREEWYRQKSSEPLVGGAFDVAVVTLSRDRSTPSDAGRISMPVVVNDREGFFSLRRTQQESYGPALPYLLAVGSGRGSRKRDEATFVETPRLRKEVRLLIDQPAHEPRTLRTRGVDGQLCTDDSSAALIDPSGLGILGSLSHGDMPSSSELPPGTSWENLRRQLQAGDCIPEERYVFTLLGSQLDFLRRVHTLLASGSVLPPLERSSRNHYRDVYLHFAEPYLHAAKHVGLIHEQSSTFFGSDLPLSREDYAGFLKRFFSKHPSFVAQKQACRHEGSPALCWAERMAFLFPEESTGACKDQGPDPMVPAPGCVTRIETLLGLVRGAVRGKEPLAQDCLHAKSLRDWNGCNPTTLEQARVLGMMSGYWLPTGIHEVELYKPATRAEVSVAVHKTLEAIRLAQPITASSVYLSQ